jgi:hypothetical protein
MSAFDTKPSKLPPVKITANIRLTPDQRRELEYLKDVYAKPTDTELIKFALSVIYEMAQT